MTRSVVFDTETTGLDPLTGHRVIEVACIELWRDLPTGRVFHEMVDPERDIPDDATRIHGFTNAHLAGKPRFSEIAAALHEFFEDSPLIAHNAPFDFGFLNAEFTRFGHTRLDLARMIDTLVMAKTRFPGLPNSLDSLCRRFGIDLSERTSHNALLDCRLLADVYVELTGGRQPTLLPEQEAGVVAAVSYAAIEVRRPVLLVPDDATLARHAAFVARLKDPVWDTLNRSP